LRCFVKSVFSPLPGSVQSVVPETIAAVATPGGEGAIAVIRVSGSEAFQAVNRVFKRRGKAGDVLPRRVYLGEIRDERGKLDEVLVTFFPAPNSYTGEDLVEVSCHGGILLTRCVLLTLLHHGARLAEPGEFTQRAFLNSKMDLTQAEAVMDLIRAQTDLALRAANEQLAGTLGRELSRLRDELLTLLAHVEAYIDFPDEKIDPETGHGLEERGRMIQAGLRALLATAVQGRILRQGLRTVIAGTPNVGKSSLLNLLLGYERAIVSEIPGTTRDTIEEAINVLGLPVRLIDTAGTRVSEDCLEREGIRRTEAQLAQADLVLWVVDASVARFSDPPSEAILILNKIDLGLHPDWKHAAGIRFSCKTRTGLENLNQAVWDKAMGELVRSEDLHIAISARHQLHLEKAVALLEAALTSLQQEVSPEFISIDLRDALEALGEIVGRLDSEDLLGRIFSEFCIGK
jgi:tRNA modification GTPase